MGLWRRWLASRLFAERVRGGWTEAEYLALHEAEHALRGRQ